MFRLYETNAVPTLNRYITLARFYVHIYLSDLQVFTHMLNEGCIKDNIEAVWEKQGGKSQTGIETRKRKEQKELAMNQDCAISDVCLRAMASKVQIKPVRSVIYTTILLEFNLYPTLLLKKLGFVVDPLMASGVMVERV